MRPSALQALASWSSSSVLPRHAARSLRDRVQSARLRAELSTDTIADAAPGHRPLDGPRLADAIGRRARDRGDLPRRRRLGSDAPRAGRHRRRIDQARTTVAELRPRCHPRIALRAARLVGPRVRRHTYGRCGRCRARRQAGAERQRQSESVACPCAGAGRRPVASLGAGAQHAQAEAQSREQSGRRISSSGQVRRAPFDAADSPESKRSRRR